MEKTLAAIFPVADVEHDVIVSKQGDLSLVFSAKLPEIFTLSVEEYENIHQGMIRALKALPAGYIFHKQDWFRSRKYVGDASGELSFLQSSGERFFTGRKYLDHDCYFILTQPASERRQVTSLVNNLLRPHIVAAQTICPELLQQFENIGTQFMRLVQ